MKAAFFISIGNDISYYNTATFLLFFTLMIKCDKFNHNEIEKIRHFEYLNEEGYNG